MANAQPFPTNWGYEALTTKGDIINASLQAWSKAGETGINAPIISSIVVGIFPPLVAFIVYIRYQKVVPALITNLLLMIGVTSVEIYYNVLLISPSISKAVYTINVLALAIFLTAAFRNKN